MEFDPSSFEPPVSQTPKEYFTQTRLKDWCRAFIHLLSGKQFTDSATITVTSAGNGQVGFEFLGNPTRNLLPGDDGGDSISGDHPFKIITRSKPGDATTQQFSVVPDSYLLRGVSDTSNQSVKNVSTSLDTGATVWLDLQATDLIWVEGKIDNGVLGSTGDDKPCLCSKSNLGPSGNVYDPSAVITVDTPTAKIAWETSTDDDSFWNQKYTRILVARYDPLPLVDGVSPGGTITQKLFLHLGIDTKLASAGRPAIMFIPGATPYSNPGDT